MFASTIQYSTPLTSGAESLPVTMDLSEPNDPSVVKDPTLVTVPKHPSGIKELPLAKDYSVVQNSRVKASITVLEYIPTQCRISASDLRLIAYGTCTK